MSHSLTIAGHTVNFNGDFSGDVTIWLPKGEAAFSVPFEVIEWVVAEKYRREAISKLEDATPQQVLSDAAQGEGKK